MPRLDDCHPQVVRALEKDGWLIDQEPFVLHVDERLCFVDFSMKRGINGTSQQIMLIEVTCFPDRNRITPDLYGAIGQYLIYRAMVIESERSIPLYLSVPHDVFTEHFDKVVMRAVNDHDIKLVIINLDEERVERWI